MRQWTTAPTVSSPAALGVLSDVVDAIALPGFAATLLARLRSVVPGTSLSVYRTGSGCRPQRYLGASHRTPDTTRDCWRAYMSGPWLRDRTLQPGAALPDAPVVCHVTAQEVPAEHRAKVYDAFGMAERLSVVRRESDASVLAINVYRHTDSRPFGESQMVDFAELAPVLLAMTRKHLTLLGALPADAPRPAATGARRQLAALNAGLTARELDVCERVLAGMTDAGIAADLALGLPTVRTYRNRAFGRLGLGFRSELFALVRSRGG